MNFGLVCKGKMECICILAVLLTSPLRGQDITGDWQGTLHPPQGNPLRIVLRVKHDTNQGLQARLYSIDQGPEAMRVDSITVDNSTVKFALGVIQGSYEGKLSVGNDSMIGTWTQGGNLPLKFEKATPQNAWHTDTSPHSIHFVTVEPGVNLEVLDWGGTGRPLVFLAGLGNSAHVFDTFAPRFTSKYHVYGITRRGFGDSDSPSPDATHYSSDRLGDDVLAVIEAFKLQKPVLAGHSIAGEELSSVGSRHPEKVSGLIYLDAGFPYALYDRSSGDPQIDMLDIRDRIEQLLPGGGYPAGQRQRIQALLASLPRLEKDLQKQLKLLDAIESPTPNSTPPPPSHPSVATAILEGEHKYTEIKVPCLAIFAVPHDPNSAAIPNSDAVHHAAAVAADLERMTTLANAFAAGVPSAQVVRLPNADHYVFRSNEGEVLRVMMDFLESLSKPR